MVDVENLVAINNTGVDVDFLGALLWYTITDMRTTREQLQEIFVRAGIDDKYMPKQICPRDAFRRASTAAEVKGFDMDPENGRKLNLLIREVRADKDTIVRQMVREVVDARNVRLEYLPVAAMRLENDTIDVHELISLAEIERATVARIRADYEVEKINYNGRAARDIVTAILRECNPIAVRPSGGVYFVPQKHETTVKALQELVGLFSGYSITAYKSQLWSIPVIDAEEQRKMVQENLEDQVAGEAGSLLQEMAKVLKAEQCKITQTTAQRYIERVRELSKVVGEYEDMLDTQITTARANLDLVRTQATALLEKVEAA